MTLDFKLLPEVIDGNARMQQSTMQRKVYVFQFREPQKIEE
jgi:hypothetical protein